MAKGDSIQIMVGTPDGAQTFTVTASKAGRTVKQVTRTRQKVQWVDVDEMTRTSRATGNSLSVPLSAVLAIQTVSEDVPDDPKPRKRKPAPPAEPTLFDAAVDRQESVLAATGRAFEALGRQLGDTE